MCVLLQGADFTKPELTWMSVQLTNAVSSNANAVIGETPPTSADGAAA